MEWRWCHFLIVTKLKMFFEGIFLEIEDYGLGEGLLNHVIF